MEERSDTRGEIQNSTLLQKKKPHKKHAESLLSEVGLNKIQIIEEEWKKSIKSLFK